jgi:hypothetical protein
LKNIAGAKKSKKSARMVGFFVKTQGIPFGFQVARRGRVFRLKKQRLAKRAKMRPILRGRSTFGGLFKIGKRFSAFFSAKIYVLITDNQYFK